MFEKMRGILGEGRTLAEVLDLQRRSPGVVFYAEDDFTYAQLEGYVQAWLRLGSTATYVTSAEEDPLLSDAPGGLNVVFLKKQVPQLFNRLSGGVLVSTMPDLGRFHVPDPKGTTATYVFHSLNSMHTSYREGAFDGYGVYFCTGPHHVRELEAITKQRGLPRRRVEEIGYHKLDRIAAVHDTYRKQYTDAPTVVIAPSWAAGNILEAHELHSRRSPKRWSCVSSDTILIRGAREHNLKNLTLELPRDKLIVFTGLSGSGKSSLAFDTIYAEGQRRYVESLSAYARQFLGRWTSPTSTSSKGCRRRSPSTRRPPPATPGRRWGPSPRSGTTCGSSTPASGSPLPQRRHPGGQTDPPADRRPDPGAGGGHPVPGAGPGGAGPQRRVRGQLLKDLASQGFARARIDGEVRDLTEDIKLDRYFQHTIEVIVDRLVSKEGIDQRLTQSLETALNWPKGWWTSTSPTGPPSPSPRPGLSGVRASASKSSSPATSRSTAPTGPARTCSGIGTRYQVDPSW
jgi:hypothetical protein